MARRPPRFDHVAKLLCSINNAENEPPTNHARSRSRFSSILGARSFMTAMCVALYPRSGTGGIGGGRPSSVAGGTTQRRNRILASNSPPARLVLVKLSRNASSLSTDIYILALHATVCMAQGDPDHPGSPTLCEHYSPCRQSRPSYNICWRLPSLPRLPPVPPDDICVRCVPPFQWKKLIPS